MSRRNRRLGICQLVLAASVLLMAGGARADVLSPAPEECPRGSEGTDCHGPPRCEPLECTGDEDCADGMSCERLELCIVQINCSGRMMVYVDTVLSVCGEGTPCSDGDCQSRRVCVPGGEGGEDASIGDDADAPADAAIGGETDVRTWGCGGCSLSGSSRAGGALLLALIPTLMVLLRRRS